MRGRTTLVGFRYSVDAARVGLVAFALGCFGDDPAPRCAGDVECAAGGSCIDGTCYGACPNAASSNEVTLVPTDGEPPVGEVILGNGTSDSRQLVDLNFDGTFTAEDLLPSEFAPQAPSVPIDTDGDGVPDFTAVDFDGDGFPDNRFYFDDRSAWVPDADSFDDYENADANPPVERGVTPVSADCPGDGVETGPPDLGFTDYRPSSYCLRVVQRVDGSRCLAAAR